MKLLFLILLTIPVISFSQTIIEYDKSTYTEVVSVDSVSKEELYIRARSWFATAFKSAQDVIQMDDRDAGKIIGKGALKYKSQTGNPGHNGWTLFTYTVETKDGRFRILVENIRHESLEGNRNGGLFHNERPACGTAKISLKNWDLLRKKGVEDILDYVNNMKAEMSKPASSDNW